MYMLGPYGFIYAVYRHTDLRGIKLPYGPINGERTILRVEYLLMF